MVTSACFSRVVLLVFLSLLAASTVVSARRIDCTRFVFAPKCRGVAAKRGDNSLTTDDSTDLEDTYTDSLWPSEGSRDEESERFLRLLKELSRAMRHSAPQAPPASRGNELLNRLLRS
ncbi:elevenin-like [Littorina saxatilis]|uniref:elevenin-like n=1 Tax=Littorina saxatilis TaxID=31220 RepID=UPI0038B60FBB